jgi:hypothetical protein
MEDQIDVSSDSSSEIEQQTEQQPSDSAPAESAPEANTAPAKTDEENVPFHLHPRFQEVIFQKNQLAEQTKALQQQIQEMQKNFAKQAPQQTEEDKLIARLKGIDPEFGGRFAELDAMREQMRQFKDWQEQVAREKTQLEINSTKDKLYTEHNIPAERRSIYEAMIREQAIANPQLQISDLPKVFKSVHDNISKLFGQVERQVTKSYVESKTAAASKPSPQPKGQPVKQVNGTEYSKNPQEARAQLIKEIMREAREGKDI